MLMRVTTLWSSGIGDSLPGVLASREPGAGETASGGFAREAIDPGEELAAHRAVVRQQTTLSQPEEESVELRGRPPHRQRRMVLSRREGGQNRIVGLVEPVLLRVERLDGEPARHAMDADVVTGNMRLAEVGRRHVAIVLELARRRVEEGEVGGGEEVEALEGVGVALRCV